MRELWPDPADAVDIGLRLAGDERPKPAGRPWVALVMITSLDGAIAIEGVSGGLGGPSDQERFLAARRLADGIIVGAGTARAEDYRPSDTPIAVVTGSLSLDPGARLFGDPTRKPIVFTTTEAAGSRGPDFVGVAEVVDLGESIDPGLALADLNSRGMDTVLLEGGPTLNGTFVDADLVDELLLTVSPVLAGGDGPGIAIGAGPDPDRRFVLDRVLTAADLVFLRYLRAR